MNYVRGKNLVSFQMDIDKWVVPIGIDDIDVLVLGKKHFNPLFCWESMGQFSFMTRIYFLFAMDIDKWIFPNGINDIDSLFW